MFLINGVIGSLWCYLQPFFIPRLRSYNVMVNTTVNAKKAVNKLGAMKRGRGMCIKFKAFNLTYLQVPLHAGMVYINIG